MKRSIIATAIALCLAFALPAAADVRTHPAAQVSIEVPGNWKVESDGDSMTATDPSDEIALFFMILDAASLEKALSAIDSEVGKVVKNAKWEGEGKEVKLNGMDAVVLDGTGTIEGTAADLGVMLLATPAGKILLVLGAVESSKASKHQATVEKLMKSIKPAK